MATTEETKEAMRDLMDDPEYQAFVESMLKFCHCEYDQPCDSVLAAGPCERKAIDESDYYDSEDW